jgi:hypothetical protein
MAEVSNKCGVLIPNFVYREDWKKSDFKFVVFI